MKKEKLKPEAYEKLKVFMGLYFDWYMARPHSSPKSHPLLVLTEFEKTSLSQAGRGLEMAINDCVEMSSDWTPGQVAEADAKFTSHGTFTLTEIRRRYSRKYLQILKRGVVRSEKEYYLLKGMVDGGSIETGATEGQQIEAMLAAYEANLIKLKRA